MRDIQVLKEYHGLGLTLAPHGQIFLEGSLARVALNIGLTLEYDLITSDLTVTEGKITEDSEELVGRVVTGLERIERAYQLTL